MNDQLHLEIEEKDRLPGLWQRVLAEVEPRIGREAVEGWLRDALPIELGEDRLVLAATNVMAKTWIEKKFTAPVQAALRELTGTALRLEVVVQKEAASAKGTRGAAAPKPQAAPSFPPLPLNEKYTFANFVVGQSNRFAHAAASAVADRPGREYNPLFIYGGVGLGKTHLLQAIGHELVRNSPRTRVAYISGETFTSQFITSLREHREEEFRRSYRAVDVWLVDDVQFIMDKTSTKEEFFHTFNELYLTNRQIVLAADRPPSELRTDDRLRSRFQSGLMVEIIPPELETRMAILQQRAALEGVSVSEDVLYPIAHTVTDNIRVLEAAIIRLLALSSLNNCRIDAELAARAVGAFVKDAATVQVSLLAILRAVCEHFQISEETVTSARRDRETSLARQVAMYLMRELSSQPLTEIGKVFGGKAHSTVLYACGKLEQEMKVDPALETRVSSLRSHLAGQPARETPPVQRQSASGRAA